jgi:hypothetical protein
MNFYCFISYRINRIDIYFRSIAMGRESNITYELVAATADKLQANGIKPTNRAVLAALGMGSLTTIGRHMNSYKAGQVRQSSAIDDLIDPAIMKSISNHTAIKVQEATSSLTANLADAQEENEALLSECEKQLANFESVSSANIILVAENASLKGQAQQLETENARLLIEITTERTQSEASRVEVAKMMLRLDAMPKVEAELEKVRADFENYRVQSISTLNLAVAESASLHEVAAVATAKLQGESTMRASISDALKEVTRRCDEVTLESKKYVAEAAELRGKLQSKNESLVNLCAD